MQIPNPAEQVSCIATSSLPSSQSPPISINKGKTKKSHHLPANLSTPSASPTSLPPPPRISNSTTPPRNMRRRQILILASRTQRTPRRDTESTPRPATRRTARPAPAVSIHSRRATSPRQSTLRRRAQIHRPRRTAARIPVSASRRRRKTRRAARREAIATIATHGSIRRTRRGARIIEIPAATAAVSRRGSSTGEDRRRRHGATRTATHGAISQDASGGYILAALDELVGHFADQDCGVVQSEVGNAGEKVVGADERALLVRGVADAADDAQ